MSHFTLFANYDQTLKFAQNSLKLKWYFTCGL